MYTADGVVTSIQPLIPMSRELKWLFKYSANITCTAINSLIIIFNVLSTEDYEVEKLNILISLVFDDVCLQAKCN